MTYRFYLGMSSIDGAGVLFYPELFRHAHDAYEAFMRERGGELAKLPREGLALPIVHAEADYRSPLRHGQAVDVILRLERLGTSSFTLAYEFTADDGGPGAVARTVHVCVDSLTGRPLALPERLRGILLGIC